MVLGSIQRKTLLLPPAGVKANRVRVYVPAINTILKLAGDPPRAFAGSRSSVAPRARSNSEDANHCLIASNTIRGVGDYTGSGVAVAGGTHTGWWGMTSLTWDAMPLPSQGVTERR